MGAQAKARLPVKWKSWLPISANVLAGFDSEPGVAQGWSPGRWILRSFVVGTHQGPHSGREFEIARLGRVFPVSVHELIPERPYAPGRFPEAAKEQAWARRLDTRKS